MEVLLYPLALGFVLAILGQVLQVIREDKEGG